MLSRYRNNLISTNTNHFSSYGQFFGIGIRASYLIDGLGRSFGQYRYKKGSKMTGKILTEEIEDELLKIIEQSMTTINSYFQLNKKVLGLVTNALSKCIYKKYKTDKISPSDYFADLYLCIDAGTTNFHTEYDKSNTIIIYPIQEDGYYHEVYFQFLINHNTIYSFYMTTSVILLYTPYLLTHRQTCKSKSGYINIAAYTNRRIIQNLRTSVCRDK